LLKFGKIFQAQTLTVNLLQQLKIAVYQKVKNKRPHLGGRLKEINSGSYPKQRGVQSPLRSKTFTLEADDTYFQLIRIVPEHEALEVFSRIKTRALPSGSPKLLGIPVLIQN